MELLLSPFGQEKVLAEELQYRSIKILQDWGRLKLIEPYAGPLYFAQVRVAQAVQISFQSITQAQEILRSQRLLWGNFSVQNHRRSALIQAGLKKAPGPVAIGTTLGTPSESGLWALIDAQTLIYGAAGPHPVLGEAHMVEDHLGPPSRAYLKLWELFTFHAPAPLAGAKVLDLGAAPGGWSWALAESFKCQVLAVDRSSLDKKLLKNPRIRFLEGSAFQIDPAEHQDRDWVMSDIICYPKKLLEYFQRWDLVQGRRGFVATLKFQAQTDFEVVDQFAQISGSRLVHLFHNKHELTWFMTPIGAGQS